MEPGANKGPTTYDGFVFVLPPGNEMHNAAQRLATARLARQSAVNWDGFIERGDHFYLLWKVPATYRAAWSWGGRVFTHADHGGMLELYAMDGGYDEEALQAARYARAGVEIGEASSEPAASEPEASGPPAASGPVSGDALASRPAAASSPSSAASGPALLSFSEASRHAAAEERQAVAPKGAAAPAPQLFECFHPVLQLASPRPLLEQAWARYDVSAESFSKGTFGTVHRANFVEGHLPVVVKMVATKEAAWEAYVLTACRGSPDIVRLLNVIAKPGDKTNVGLVLEPMDGDLRKYLEASRPGGFAPPQCRRAVAGICGGLRHLHALHLLHADLKPANVLTIRRRMAWKAGGQEFIVKLGDCGCVEQAGPGAPFGGGAGARAGVTASPLLARLVGGGGRGLGAAQHRKESKGCHAPPERLGWPRPNIAHARPLGRSGAGRGAVAVAEGLEPGPVQGLGARGPGPGLWGRGLGAEAGVGAPALRR